MSKVRKVFLGSFLGALLAALISSTYFYTFFKKSVKKLDEDLKFSNDLDKWEDVKSF